ncbi:LLM class flavin-dependent oxidoreductase [bacterium]|nr:LLM class flavin-dependent oxidoreductase [bacterium]
MSSKETIKILLYKRGMTITKLAQILTETTGHKYTRQSISNKLARNSIRYNEMEIIAKILNYKIEFVDI